MASQQSQTGHWERRATVSVDMGNLIVRVEASR
jgi:hypothetical protein